LCSSSSSSTQQWQPGNLASVCGKARIECVHGHVSWCQGGLDTCSVHRQQCCSVCCSCECCCCCGYCDCRAQGSRCSPVLTQSLELCAVLDMLPWLTSCSLQCWPYAAGALIRVIA
jgi:hypothetical protein